LFWTSSRRTICGISVGVSFFCDSNELAEAIAKLESALCLVRDYAPVRFAQVQRDLRCIFVMGLPTYYGRYIRSLGMCQLYDRYVLAAGTTPSLLASTIVHEAQHARLARLGFAFEEPRKERIERLCFLASRNLGLRIPDGSDVVQEVDARLNSGERLAHSEASDLRARLAALDKLRIPMWWKTHLRGRMIRRARRH
jgi:hypothetical protein